VTTIRRALEAAERGEPTALRMAVEALGAVLDLLDDIQVNGVASGSGVPS
jgi:hypothetical protein